MFRNHFGSCSASLPCLPGLGGPGSHGNARLYKSNSRSTATGRLYLYWRCHFQVKRLESCQLHVHLSFNTCFFDPSQGRATFQSILDFPIISCFFGNPLSGFDLDKFSTIWISKVYGWIRMKKLICLLPSSGQMARQLSTLHPSNWKNLLLAPSPG